MQGYYCVGGQRYPCPRNTYQPVLGASSDDACAACPLLSSSLAASPSLASCLCAAAFFMDGDERCSLCPQPGTNCSLPGATLEQLQLSYGFWRETNYSVAILP